MVMNYGEMEMPVDDATLEVIRQAEKDYRGQVTFAGTETIGQVPCDRYTYDIKTDAYRETGTLWLSDTIPFALVRQKGQVVNADGTADSDFEMVLQEHGRTELASAEPASEPAPAPPAQPITTTLAEGFQAGRIGLDVEALPGGRQLKVNFRNEYEAQLTLELAAGPVDLEVGFPAETLRLTIPKPSRLVLEAGTSSEALTVTQRGPRGIAEGKCYMSVYEGTPIFQGSATMDQLPK